jgi:predicted methyltransferase
MISFFEIGRGDRVADLGGLFGYSLEPFLDAVGGAGVVYARLRPGLSPDAVPYAHPDRSHQGELIWMKTPLTAPFSPDAKRLNVVTLLYAYHSIVAENQDRKAFNDSVYRALVPGGTYIIVDHAAPPGSGVAAAARLNRIEDRVVRAEVEAAGFRFIEAADFVLDAPRTPGAPPPSQYVLKFKRPK